MTEDAIDKLIKSRELVFRLSDSGVPIYGFTVGVGWNKDKKIFGRYFAEYNRNLIYAHCVSVGPYLSVEETRAVIVSRLNALLCAKIGIQLEVVNMYQAFLNLGIHPRIPSRGSVGEADIANLSHIGLAMLGEGDVEYKGTIIPAIQALKAKGLSPVELGPKDGLSIVSSNAIAAGTGALVLDQAIKLLEIANAVYELSVEGLNGNITPLREAPNAARKMPSQIACAAQLREMFSGSYLEKKGITKALQDPFSYRCVAGIHSAQAVDLRKTTEMGKASKLLYDAIRAEIPFLDQDRPLSYDIQKAYEVLNHETLIESIRVAAGSLKPHNW